MLNPIRSTSSQVLDEARPEEGAVLANSLSGGGGVVLTRMALARCFAFSLPTRGNGDHRVYVLFRTRWLWKGWCGIREIRKFEFSPECDCLRRDDTVSLEDKPNLASSALPCVCMVRVNPIRLLKN